MSYLAGGGLAFFAMAPGLLVCNRILRKRVRQQTRELEREITRHRATEAALRENETRQRAMIENISDVIAIIDQDGINRYKSPNIERWFGWRPEEVVGVSTWENVHPEDQACTHEAFATFQGKPNSRGTGQCRYKCKDGSYKWIEYTAVNLLHEPDIRGILFNYRDITERKQAEEEKRKLQDKLTQAQKMESIGRLAGGVAHDFNNMLSVILGNVELALEQLAAGKPLHDELNEVRKAALRSADLTRQLLAFARRQEVTPRVLDLNETVDGTLRMLRRLIGEDIDLAWKPGAELWPVKIDSAQINQVLANLAVNARDAIGGVGKITIETRNIACDHSFFTAYPNFVPGDYVLLELSDNGCGMDRETQSKIFEPFFTTKELGKGTGLGLATVYGVVRQNQGFIHVYSEPGKGTTFRIYLPRHAGEADRVAAESLSPNARGKAETVLVVEDEPAILKLSETLLSHLGYTVLPTSTPREAIRLASRHAGEIRLLISDVVMPEMNGRELAMRLTSLHPKLKRLFMSGYTADIIAHQGILEPGTPFIPKPFSMNDLAAKVREVLEG